MDNPQMTPPKDTEKNLNSEPPKFPDIVYIKEGAFKESDLPPPVTKN